MGYRVDVAYRIAATNPQALLDSFLQPNPQHLASWAHCPTVFLKTLKFPPADEMCSYRNLTHHKDPHRRSTPAQ